jgi:DEAD/DEAH box helicase domain-containing protein
MFNEVIFDLETKKFFDDVGKKDPALLGVSVVAIYRRKIDASLHEIEGEMLSFWENEFAEMWPIFSTADRIIGFNSLGFDVPALKSYAPAYFPKLPHFDIYAELKKVSGHGASLDAIAKSSLGKNKIDSGANAVAYWAKGDTKSLAKLETYCREDVVITKGVYDFGIKNKYLLFNDRWNNPRHVAVDFSYVEKGTETAAGSQATLF